MHLRRLLPGVDTVSTAAYQRQWRAKHRSDQPPGRPVTAPHGTTAAYKRHQRHGEHPCAECRRAWNDWQREYYASRNAKKPLAP
jgi:hypothetical protein